MLGFSQEPTQRVRKWEYHLHNFFPHLSTFLRASFWAPWRVYLLTCLGAHFPGGNWLSKVFFVLSMTLSRPLRNEKFGSFPASIDHVDFQWQNIKLTYSKNCNVGIYLYLFGNWGLGLDEGMINKIWFRVLDQSWNKYKTLFTRLFIDELVFLLLKKNYAALPNFGSICFKL